MAPAYVVRSGPLPVAATKSLKYPHQSKTYCDTPDGNIMEHTRGLLEQEVCHDGIETQGFLDKYT